MINLLPPDIKEEYRYGARNTMLLRWVTAFVVALVGLGVITTYGLLTIQNSANSYASQVATAQTHLNEQNLKGTEKQVTEISSDFHLVAQVLSKEVLFSKLLRQIATVIPANTSLSSLNINQTSGGIDISASALNYSAATQLQLNLQDPSNKIFSKADIISINCASTSSDSPYPCQVQLRALFAKNNPYLFINSKAGS